MSKNTNAQSVATAAEVRTWSVKKGLRSAETKVIGRLSNDEVTAFNKAHKAKQYAPGVKPARTINVKVQTKNAKGANITKVVKVEADTLRKALKAEGQRGRVNGAKAAEYVIGAGLV